MGFLHQFNENDMTPIIESTSPCTSANARLADATMGERLRSPTSSELDRLRTLWDETWNRKAVPIPWFSLQPTKRDSTLQALKDVPSHHWVFKPPPQIAVELLLNPSAVLFREDYLNIFPALFESAGLKAPTTKLSFEPGAVFQNPFSELQASSALIQGERVVKRGKSGFILTGQPGIGA